MYIIQEKSYSKHIYPHTWNDIIQSVLKMLKKIDICYSNADISTLHWFGIQEIWVVHLSPALKQCEVFLFLILYNNVFRKTYQINKIRQC
ncbi:hypothetical protein ACRRTK_012143 [Alexandromys fortis]